MKIIERFQSTKAIKEFKRKSKKCKEFESSNSMDAGFLSVATKERSPIKH